MTLYRVVVPHFVAGVVADGETIIATAPILKWTRGKPLPVLRAWVRSKRGTVERVETGVEVRVIEG
jgi:hypothetical protein